MISPTDLTTEYAPNPINIDTRQPRFGWLLQSDHRDQSQSAYQVLVATSAENLQTGRADKWDSGKVPSDRSVNVPYAGNSLSSDENCYWQVRVWDQDDRASAYSEPSAFSMGLLDESDWTGTWIGAPTDVASPLLRTEFDLANPVSRAHLHISGLGWYELYLNGQRVADHVLDPATSDYTQRILYVTYDVTELLQAGANAVGELLPVFVHQQRRAYDAGENHHVAVNGHAEVYDLSCHRFFHLSVNLWVGRCRAFARLDLGCPAAGFASGP